MSLPRTHHKPISGQWKQLPSGKVIWREFLSTFGDNFKDFDPLDLIGISREADFKIVFVKTDPDPTKFNSRISRFFCQDVHMELREDVSENIVLKFGSDKCYYISDLTPLGKTLKAVLESNPELIVNISEPYLISQIQAIAFLNQWNYGYGRVEVSANGSIEYYKTV